jgi:hypothetical protein
MASLIPEIEITDFNKLTISNLKRLKCCEVYSDGEYLFTFTRPQTDYIRSMAENNGELSNSVGGESLATITHTVATVTVPSVTTSSGDPEIYVSDKPYKSKRKKKKIKVAK